MLIRERQAGRPCPALDARPEPFEDLAPVWEAFLDLSSSRPNSGFGPLPIPAAEIAAVLDLRGIEDSEDRRDWYSMLRAADRAWLAWHARRRSSENPSNGDPAPTPTRH